jgi:hypothetical protein
MEREEAVTLIPKTTGVHDLWDKSTRATAKLVVLTLGYLLRHWPAKLPVAEKRPLTGYLNNALKEQKKYTYR